MSSSTLPRSTPTAEGVAADRVIDFLDAVEEGAIELHSLMVLRRGQVVAEGWWQPYSPDRVHLLYSLSKSFTSTAAGFARAEGLLDLDAPVISYFPELEADAHPATRTVLVRHVASMSTGHLEDALERAYRLAPDDPVRGFFGVPPEREPGSVFAYNNIATYVLGAIVARVSGVSLLDYLRPRLLEPLGIDQAYWLEHPAGRNIGFSGLHLVTESIAKLGQVYLDGGRWQGAQLVPADWVAEATRVQTPNPAEPNPDWQQGYGFQFWMARHGYRGDGAYGQFCVVLPEQDAVVAITAAVEDMQAVLDAVWAHLLPAFGAVGSGEVGSAGPADAPAADAELARRLGELSLPRPAGAPVPSNEEAWSDARFATTTEPSVLGIEAFELRRGESGGWEGVLHDTEESLAFAVGVDRWPVTEATTRGGAVVPVSAAGAWADSDTFVAHVHFVDTPHAIEIACDRAARSCTITWRTAPLHTYSLEQMRAPRR